MSDFPNFRGFSSIFETKLWKPKYFLQNSKTSDSDSQQSRLACVGVSEFRLCKKYVKTLILTNLKSKFETTDSAAGN